MKQNVSSTRKTRSLLAAPWMGMGLFVIFILSGCQFLQNGQLLSSATETPVFPTLFVPTPDCGSPTLVLGSTTFQIQTLTPAADGSLSFPAGTPGTAYWVEGTDSNYVFVLGPTPENLAIMPTITVGTPAKLTWSNCNSTTYSLSAPQPGTFNSAELPDQSVDGITVFFQTDSSGAAFVFTGELTEEQISTFNTPVPGVTDIQAEISLLETTTAP